MDFLTFTAAERFIFLFESKHIHNSGAMRMEMSFKPLCQQVRLDTHSHLQYAAGKKQSSLIGPWEKTPEQSIQQFIMHLTDD